MRKVNYAGFAATGELGADLPGTPIVHGVAAGRVDRATNSGALSENREQAESEFHGVRAGLASSGSDEGGESADAG
jgi:hypothetical protein